MNYQELSIKNLTEIDKKLYNKIRNNYKYDIVIFVAKGAYLIGKDFADFNNCPLLEIKASRSGGRMKKILSPFLIIMPEKLKTYLRKKEVSSNVHSQNKKRNVEYDKNIYKKYKNAKKILLVDDSIDTGYTIKCVMDELKNYFDKSIIKVVSLNYFDKAKKIVEPDYFLYKNTMLKGPWSNDSKEHVKYLKMYKRWKEAEYK